MCVKLPKETACALRPQIGFVVTNSSHGNPRQKSVRSSYASFVVVSTPSHDRALQRLGVDHKEYGCDDGHHQLKSIRRRLEAE